MSRLFGCPKELLAPTICLIAALASLCSTLQAENLERLAIRTLRLETSDDSRAVISAIEFQPGGKLVAAAGDTHLVHVWDRDSGQIKYRLSGHQDWVRSLSVSPTGRWLVSGGNDGRVIVWDLDNGRKHAELPVQNAAVRTVKFSQTGALIGVCAFGQKLSVYHATSREKLFEFDCDCRDVGTIAFSPDDWSLAAGGRDGKIQVWNLRKPKQQANGKQAHQRRIRDLAFSRDGKSIASCGDDGRLAIWNLEDDTQRVVATVKTKHFCLAYVGEDKLAAGGCDNTIAIWDLQNGELEDRLIGHAGTVTALVSQGDTLASGGFDTTIRLWRVNQAQRPSGAEDQAQTVRQSTRQSLGEDISRQR